MKSCFLCVCESTFECLNQYYETCYVYHGIKVHINDVFHKSLSSVYVGMCSFLSLLGNVSVKTLQQQRLGKHQYKNCWTRRFLSGPFFIIGKYAISSSQNSSFI
jgi:hypothetical protein